MREKSSGLPWILTRMAFINLMQTVNGLCMHPKALSFKLTFSASSWSMTISVDMTLLKYSTMARGMAKKLGLFVALQFLKSSQRPIIWQQSSFNLTRQQQRTALILDLALLKLQGVSYNLTHLVSVKIKLILSNIFKNVEETFSYHTVS